MLFTVLIVISIVIVITLYIAGKCNENYWKKRGVTFYEKNRLTGPFLNFLTDKEPLFIHLFKIYQQYPNEPAVGIGGFLTPTLYIRDPANVQAVLSSDFNSFYHRGVEINEDDVLANNILFLNGNKWKLIRQSMTPLFTASKLKSMFYIIDKSAQDFLKYLRENKEIQKGDAFKTLSTFCSAAICATVFGVNTESIFDSPFLKIARGSFRSTLITNIQFLMSHFAERFCQILNIKAFKQFEDFFVGAIKQVIRQREIENIRRHDFADICIALKNSGKLVDPDTGLELETTDELLAAQAFFFFVAGVEPIATAMFATFVELGKNSEIQKRVQDEVDGVFEEHNGPLSYDIISEMVYLDMVIKEAMRLHPAIGFVTRKCVQNTILPVGNIKVDKGTKIFVPIYELHHDPKYFPEPELFKPDRFSSENKHNILDITYLPFGKGKRICIGMRYAHMQVKTGLVHILRHFSIKTNINRDGIKYMKHQIQVRLENVDVEFVPR
ncbi:cytochrome P450 6k1-like [Danaus plexippus]|uniref:cytochrome P450 6k1-like n=1 Tax=Danaus plexippus TaxID=13037 RepID=UPI002AB0E420|nr:cytochrome P450 6k1-like [Danaus plexippus]